MSFRLNSKRVQERYFVVGGAGFIGSHMVEWLLSHEEVPQVTIYDNFSSGQHWHIEHLFGDKRLKVIEADVKDRETLWKSMEGHDTVVHLASNPDIAAAATDPEIDFREGTVLTNNVVEGMRRTSCSRILYTSGSGVYGDLGEDVAHEEYGPMIPISTYGASKLAGEVLISSYCHMFGITACVFRFGNVVGPKQTHGVGYDFARRLKADPTCLRILGDGKQSKTYVHISDIIKAVYTAHNESQSSFDTFNVATGDYITVTEIADVACSCIGLDPQTVNYQYTGGDRGWKGDVPIVRMSAEKIKKLGWQCERNSAQAIHDSISAMVQEIIKKD